MKNKLTIVYEDDVWNIIFSNNQQIENLCKPGTKFRILSDRDPWYIVGHLIDNVKNTDSCQVVYKSWSKYKNRWCYKVNDIYLFMYELAMKKELYRDNNGNFVIKENK